MALGLSPSPTFREKRCKITKKIISNQIKMQIRIDIFRKLLQFAWLVDKIMGRIGDNR